MADSSFRINRGATLNPQASAPLNPTNGDIYYDSTIGSFVFYNNGNWSNLSSRSDVASATNLTSTQFTAAIVQATLIRVTGSTASSLHGLVAPSDSHQVLIYNQSSATLTVKFQSGTEGTAANRIITSSGADMSVAAGQMVSLIYDSAQSRWVAIAQAVALNTPLPMIGSVAGDSLDSALVKADAELAKLFEDRNVLLTDGGLITFTGTQLQFTENLNIVLNSKVAGGAPTVISLGSTTRTLSASGRMLYAVLNRTGGTAVVTDDATTLAAVTSTDQEVFLIAKRVDAGDGTQRVYWRNGMGQNAGQTLRLGAAGSGSGSGTGDDINSLQFQASFTDVFDESSTATLSAVNPTGTNASYDAAKGLYKMFYDAGKTIAGGTTTTNIELSATVTGFTAAIGDMVINAGIARKITAVASQSSFTVEAFPTAPTVSSQVTVSQAVLSKDVYGTAFDGSAISAAFGATTFSEILVDYEDTTTSGDDIFDIGTAPVVAYTASPDNTSWTVVNIRPTLETTQIAGITLPSAGTALYLRWFANKTTGSGSVNILRYKAFMQRATVLSSGGTLNSAFAQLNGVGAATNCTLGILGGKTSVTLNFTYALGINSGSPYGSIDVLINGQIIPRYIDATSTPDGSYTEVSPNVILLDKNYSAYPVPVEVIQRVSVIDTSEQTSLSTASLKEMHTNGERPFVNNQNMLSATSGTPTATQFYSSIGNRAAITDLTQDLKVSLGLDRIYVQEVYQIINETGPSSELVFGEINDDKNLIRCVGNWSNLIDTNGVHVDSSVVGDFIEVTFYGTGLFIHVVQSTANMDMRATTDNGSEGANFFATGYSSILGGRNTSPNQVVSVVQNLTLGVHTVKMRNNSTNTVRVQGFQILNAQTTLKVNSGVSYANGTKLSLITQQSPSYNSTFETGTLGTRGGHVLVYQKSNGDIAKAVTPTNASSLNLSSTSHINEEIARTHHYREFGAHRTANDDFSSLSTTESTRAFTIEDGTTTLRVQNAVVDGTTGALTYGSTATHHLTFEFVGTGLDVELSGDGAAYGGNVQVFIDGTSVFNGTRASLFGANRVNTTFKVVSGLPYGTHTVKFANVTNGNRELFRNFIIYQPKTPTLPAGCIKLADYNIMADYVANATQSDIALGTGILRKASTREITYSGTWTASIAVSDIGGWQVFSQTTGNYLEYTFFGTGFDLRMSSGGTNAWTLLVDGSSNLTVSNGAFWTGSLTTSSYGLTSFAPSTGLATYQASVQLSTGISVSGMNLGWHTVRFTRTSGGAVNNDLVAFDIVTPIHSQKSNLNYDQQNSLPIGSQSISDNRVFTPVKDAGAQKKNILKAVGLTSGPTTTSTAFLPMPDMSVTMIKKEAGPVELLFTGRVSSSAGTLFLLFMVDGQAVDWALGDPHATMNSTSVISISASTITHLSAGAHKIDVHWSVSAGTGTATTVARILTAKEL